MNFNILYVVIFCKHFVFFFVFFVRRFITHLIFYKFRILNFSHICEIQISQMWKIYIFNLHNRP